MDPREKIYREANNYFEALSNYSNPYVLVYLEMSEETQNWLTESRFDSYYHSIRPVDLDGFSGFCFNSNKKERLIRSSLQTNTCGVLDGQTYTLIRFPIVLNCNVLFQKVRMTSFQTIGKRIPSYWFGSF